MLEIQLDNSDKIHVYVQGTILKFTIFEFAVITDLKSTGNINDYLYTNLSTSTLMPKYLSNTKSRISKLALIQRVKMGKFDNTQDALNMAILYFIHTFLLS